MSNVIEVKGLTKSFADKQVLKGLDFIVPEQSVYAFLGNNGAGKSTFIRILLGLIKKDSGSINLFNQQLSRYQIAHKAHIGTIIDSAVLYEDLTASEFLSMSCRLKGVAKVDIHRVLEKVDMQAEAHRKMSQYSLGMKQRIAIANALLGEPRLLVLDEPTNGLDPQGMIEIRELIQSIPRDSGCTVFVSSHLLDEVEKMASHVAILKQGEIVSDSPLSELLTSSGQLKIEVSQEATCLALLNQNNYQISKIEGNQLTIEQVDKPTSAAIHKLLLEHQIDLFQSHFIAHSLESHFSHINQAEA